MASPRNYLYAISLMSRQPSRLINILYPHLACFNSGRQLRGLDLARWKADIPRGRTA